MEDATEASWAAPDGGPEIVDANDVAMQRRGLEDRRRPSKF